MKRVPIMIAVLCVAGWMTAGVRGQDSQQQQRQQSKQQQQQQQQQEKRQQDRQDQQKRIASVTGKLQDMRTVNVTGDGQHVLAKLLTKSGKTIVVDLGRPQDLSGRKFRRGQEISALGRGGRINGKPLIVADRIRDNSQREPLLTIVRIVPMPTLTIVPQQPDGAAQQATDRQQQQQQQQQRQGQRQAQKQQGQQASGSSSPFHRHVISGKLLETREFTLKGKSGKHVLARVETPQGRQILVNLGKREGLQDVKLSNGEMIAATGAFARINGRPVLFADHIADLVAIDRGGSSNAQPAGARTGPQHSSASPPKDSNAAAPSDGEQQRSQQQQKRQQQQQQKRPQAGQSSGAQS